jgi:hypothetical protein
MYTYLLRLFLTQFLANNIKQFGYLQYVKLKTLYTNHEAFSEIS